MSDGPSAGWRGNDWTQEEVTPRFNFNPQPHAPTQVVYSHRGNAKHAHNTRKGTVYRNHWFNSFKCPVCGMAWRGRKTMCRGVRK